MPASRSPRTENVDGSCFATKRLIAAPNSSASARSPGSGAAARAAGTTSARVARTPTTIARLAIWLVNLKPAVHGCLNVPASALHRVSSGALAASDAREQLRDDHHHG